MKKLPILALIPASTLLFAACDDGAVSEPGDSLRQGEILKRKTPTSKSFTLHITPNPDEDGGGGVGPLFEQIIQNADAMFGAAYQGSIEAEEFCPEACAGADAAWTERVSAEGDYAIVEMNEYEYDDGTLAVEALVEGEVAMACHCAQ
ncbi:MAG: hypothetical protein ACE37F_31945 [Nannocystaceae bacterium]|nr:hypothetical protein [bacterium]